MTLDLEKLAIYSAIAGAGIYGGKTVPDNFQFRNVQIQPTGRDKYTEEQQQRKLEAAQAKRERKKAKRRKEIE